MTAIIVDDEPQSHHALKSLLTTHHPEITVIDSADSVGKGYKLYIQYRPDIIFLDIELPDGLGFDLLEKIDEPDCHIIFITAFEHYAIKAIEYGAFGYLMKPFTPGPLKDALDRVKNSIESQSAQEQIELLLRTIKELREKKLPTRMSISTLEGVLFFDIKNIIRLEASGNYTFFVLADTNKKQISSTRFKIYVKFFEPYEEFQKVHRSHMVNLHYVVKFVRAESYLLMKNGDKVPVSRNFRDDFLDGISGI